MDCETRYLKQMLRLEYDRSLPQIQHHLQKERSQPQAVHRPPVLPGIRAIGEYQMLRTLGAGSTGKVKLAVHMRTRQKVAIKIIPRARFADPSKNRRETPVSKERRIMREAAIMHLMNHPNIIRLHDFLISDEYFCLIFEYVDGPQLLDYVVTHGKLKEKQARKFFRQILSAVAYCHQNAVVHRDLKIENMLVDRVTQDIKLLDFGLCNFFSPNDKLGTFCGSLYFAAPELLRGLVYSGPEVDVWSLGIILYVLVCGKVPFDDKSLPALHEKIKNCKPDYPKHLSPECHHLLQMMIVADPARRATLDEVKRHVWTQMGFSTPILAHLLERLPLSSIDPHIVNFIAEDFRIQYTQDEITKVLQTALHDWTAVMHHPIVALYYLTKEKVQSECGTPHGSREATISIRFDGRSSSCPDIGTSTIAVPPGVLPKERASAGRSRNLTVCVPNRSVEGTLARVTLMPTL